jgi:hypothetical protein
MSPEQEPDNYTLDEMMKRLRTRSDSPSSGDEGQLVTRNDGTQAYRVRKRKRRTHQPVKELQQKKRKRRRVLITVIVSLILLCAVWSVAVLVYLNSPTNSSKVVKEVERWTGAEVRFDQFRMTPVSVAMNYMEMKWPEGSPIKSLRSHHVVGELDPTSIVFKPWTGDQLSTDSITLLLGTSAKEYTAPVHPAGEVPYSFRYRSPNLNILFGDEDRPYASVDRAECSLIFADLTASKSNLQLKSGTLRVPGQSPFFVDFASVMFDGGVHLSSLRLKPNDSRRGEITITPTAEEAINTHSGVITCRMVAEGVAFDAVLAHNLGDWFSGIMDSPTQKPGKLMVKVGKQPDISYELPFFARLESPVEMLILPCFKTIGEQVRNTWYLKPRFDLEAKGTAFRYASQCGIRDLAFEARNYLRLEGDLLVDEKGELSGQLRVGVPRASVNEAARAFQAVFKLEEKEFCWATIHLGGTLRNPEDDLAQQLKVQSGTTIPRQQQDVEQEFLDLTKPR